MASKETKSFGILDLVNNKLAKDTVKEFFKEHDEGIVICSPEDINDFYRATIGLNIKLREYFDTILNKYILSFKKLNKQP